MFIGHLLKGSKRIADEEAPPLLTTSAASTISKNDGNHGHPGDSLRISPCDGTVLISEVPEETHLQKPKVEAVETELPQGFYVVEAIRSKRTRKGKTQYLIKWLNWPETTNTWEPLENLSEVSDMIDAFEESLKSKKRRTRKRKQAAHSIEPKKRLRCSTTKTPTNNGNSKRAKRNNAHNNHVQEAYNNPNILKILETECLSPLHSTQDVSELFGFELINYYGRKLWQIGIDEPDRSSVFDA
ncbi:hypothetical protein L6164_000221 [Bauhinia variegata]|nr:hypothetical protein L6164_000221 [Bauhinia variegata]KAI4356179.1 hypothetical protein L6164_000221 [Bauhinia variegata]